MTSAISLLFEVQSNAILIAGVPLENALVQQ